MGFYGCLSVSMVFIYGYLSVFMDFMGVYGYLLVVTGFSVFMGVYECLWVFICDYGFLSVYGYLWLSWVYICVYGYLWVLYLKIRDFAYFLIQKRQKIKEVWVCWFGLARLRWLVYCLGWFMG